MESKITLIGKIEFDVLNKTTKHKNQCSWKKTAMVLFNDDMCEYYSWFIQKRFNIILNKPIRSSHISFINDSMRDLTNNGDKTEIETLELWELVKKNIIVRKLKLL